MATVERKEIWVSRNFSQWDLEGPLEYLIEQLQDCLVAYGPSVRFEVGSCDYHEGIEISMKYTRLETDLEFTRRLKREAKVKERTAANKIKLEEKERKTFERLSKKYGPV